MVQDGRDHHGYHDKAENYDPQEGVEGWDR
jgi:hypothetical protein